jgi:hypothetical protein
MSEIDDDFDFIMGDTLDSQDKAAETGSIAAKPSKTGKATGKATGAAPSRQPQRIPMYVRQPLTAAPRPGFVRRVFNDSPGRSGRIDRAKLAGWTPVEDGTKLGDKLAGQATVVGSISAKPVGGGTYGVLMELPEDLYNADQLVKQKKISDREKDMLTEATEKLGDWHGKIELRGN